MRVLSQFSALCTFLIVKPLKVLLKIYEQVLDLITQLISCICLIEHTFYWLQLIFITHLLSLWWYNFGYAIQHSALPLKTHMSISEFQ